MANKKKESPVLDEVETEDVEIAEANEKPELVTDPDTGSVSFNLQYPVSYTTKAKGMAATINQIDHVTIRRVNGGDIHIVGTLKEAEVMRHLITRLTGLKVEDYDRLDAVDIATIGEVIAGFLPKSLQIGS